MPPSTDRIRLLLTQGARSHVYPGAVWAHGTPDGITDHGAVGLLDPTDPDHPMRVETLFDVASLTKILSVWAGIGCLWQDGLLDLDAPLGGYWSEVTGHPLDQVTARQLLTHTAGVPLNAELQQLYGTDPGAIRSGVLREALHRPPGEAVEYTDRAALILGYLAEYLSRQALDRVASTRVWAPLGMTDTRFGPLADDLRARCAPTELDQATGLHLRGTVHDPSAHLLGGMCGISGVFTTVVDLARFLRHLLDPAQVIDKPGFGSRWTSESLTPHTGALVPARGLFWHPAPGTNASDDIWVHYGFTGTGMWIAPRQQRWAVLLTNKVRHNRDHEPIARIRNTFRELTCG